ncbi:t-SNARE [Halteromyces radiatus]|uniref:t-SNARE n=1 Tax=Halteromyces radiatus TaxID=101107 RepID=UPI00221FE896|nr:t-SNARE [Halteromyces radiatus]KAI8088783.1 t-SNARE [Halteromyces radiatus]
MNVDRLNDLNRGQEGQGENNNGNNGRYEMRPLLAAPTDATSMDGFLNNISQLQELIRTINDNVQRVQTHQAAMLQTADAQELARHRGQVESLTQETQTLMGRVKKQLKDIEPTSRHSDLAIRKNQFAAVTKQFMDCIERHRTTALDFQRDEAKQMERQIRIANPNATAHEIEQAIAQAEEGRPAVFAQQLLQSVSQDQRRYDAQTTLDAVQERHDDIRRLAQSVQELSDLFQEMQFLLENQAKVLGEIEVNSYDVVNNLEQGEKHVSNAIQSAKATRRKKWICFGIFITIIIIIVIVLAVKFAPSGGGGGNQQQQPQQTQH